MPVTSIRSVISAQNKFLTTRLVYKKKNHKIRSDRPKGLTYYSLQALSELFPLDLLYLFRLKLFSLQ